MRRAIKIIDETAIFLSILAGVYFGVGFLIISLFVQIKQL